MNLQQMLVKDVQDLYQAESGQASQLRQIARDARSEELRSALEDHARETEQQATRLSQILEMLAETPGGTGEVPLGVQGLTAEARKKAEEIADPGLRDLSLIAAAQKMEHYEIACYGTARAMARTLAMDQAARLLQESLNEEENADERLTQIALPLLKQVAQNQPAAT